MTDLPILYSFRRCPYAIRARLAIAVSGQQVALREVVLRDKAPEFLETSPTATVPCLKVENTILDESLDIMVWALRHSDPEGWLSPEEGSAEEMFALIDECDGPFKQHLDRYKYDTRYKDTDRELERASASAFLRKLDIMLQKRPWLFGRRASLADYAILPFVRQFANANRDWFDGEEWTALKAWLVMFETSDRFLNVMPKWQKWHAGSEPIVFPDT
ncbi:MAG: glutathione S-transferase [Roseibium sp.]|uniref:glutathione S-transferase n=1 Tax=Roseibium sp. TaxID=1936156 RepID=UPI0026324918|nr:glutathione S-transferase [Roseibium sp.]MCV0428333.1 glutathione S-transferase [Roseibium sp.]